MTYAPAFHATIRDGHIHPAQPDVLRAYLGRLEGQRVRVVVTKASEKRSLDQNAYLHVLAERISEETGESLLQTKRLATLEALGAEEGIERYSILGREFIEVRGTSSLTTDECSRVVDVLLKQAAFLGIA